MMVWRGIVAGLMLSVIALSAHSAGHGQAAQSVTLNSQVAAR